MEKYAKYKEDYHLRFKWTPITVRDTLIWAVSFPVFLYNVLKSEQVWRVPPRRHAAAPRRFGRSSRARSRTVPPHLHALTRPHPRPPHRSWSTTKTGAPTARRTTCSLPAAHMY